MIDKRHAWQETKNREKQRKKSIDKERDKLK